MTTVDVVVPCYRYGHFLRDCVESVLAQSGPSVRVLIVDDASPDNTAEVATELARCDSRVTFLRHSSNRGHIATYNEGIEWASDDYFLLLSADDYLLPGALGRVVDLMERHPEVGFAFGNAVELDDHGTEVVTDAIPSKDGECILSGAHFVQLSGARNIVPTPTAVIRTDLQKKVGGYRAELPHAGDMEMWLRLALQAAVGFIPNRQAVYRRHNGNMSLRYMGWLPDLEQRREALESFFQSSEHVLTVTRRLRDSMLYLLALDAVSLAHAAFNNGELNRSTDLSLFARRTSPKVTKSQCWAKLACKRGMGLAMWRRLHAWRESFNQSQ